MKRILVVIILSFIESACSSGAGYSLLPTSQSFSQNGAPVNNKIDILWVVDNSGSMSPLQQNLVANYNNFIQRFQAGGFDYKMAVTTTDAYLSETQFNNNPSLAAFRDGVGSIHSGYTYITPTIPNIVSNFVTNSSQGAGGSGDERAFQSMIDSLVSPLNSGFLRPGAFFAVIILSDEDDFTDPTRPELSWLHSGIADHDYANPGLPSVASIVQQLDNLTLSTSNNRHYSVSAITVKDQACQQSHLSASPTTIIGQRYIDLAGLTGGSLGSICDASYADSVANIQQQIIELGTQFYLNRLPDTKTIVVDVNGQPVVADATNGWTYNATSNSIIFHGTAVPPAQAIVNVNFNPVSI